MGNMGARVVGGNESFAEDVRHVFRREHEYRGPLGVFFLRYEIEDSVLAL